MLLIPVSSPGPFLSSSLAFLAPFFPSLPSFLFILPLLHNRVLLG